MKPRQLDLERALTARDKVGIQDLVLLDAHGSEEAVLENLKDRFTEDLIYVSLDSDQGEMKRRMNC